MSAATSMIGRRSAALAISRSVGMVVTLPAIVITDRKYARVMIDHTLGAVLAGGGSSRMGTSKADLEYLGVSFVDHACATLSLVLSTVVVVGGPVGSRDSLMDAVADAGPLAGILAALRHADGLPVMILAVDLPLVSIELVGRLVEPPLDGRRVRAATDGERLQPLCGVWGPDVVDPLEQFLAAGQRSVMAFLDSVSIDAIVTDAHTLTNINTPADYVAMHGGGEL